MHMCALAQSTAPYYTCFLKHALEMSEVARVLSTSIQGPVVQCYSWTQKGHG